VRAYNRSSEEALLARDLLKDWAGEGFITQAQYQRMQQETICELRRTNIFLRLVFFFFTSIMVGAAAVLFLQTLSSDSISLSAGPLLLIFAAFSYAAAEIAASRGLYRYGIEEALAACSVALLCGGMYVLWVSSPGSPKSNGTEFLIPATGAMASLWIWHRFGFAYAFAAAMVFIPWLSSCWTESHSAQHFIVATFYTAGLIAVVVSRSRQSFGYLSEVHSIAEALLWFGIYLAINLQLSAVDLLRHLWAGTTSTAEFSGTFYWATWVLTWCIPFAALSRGLHRKDRFVIAVGGIVAVLTLITNKPYLGWHRHTWDPMLLGALLIGIALSLHRWLSKGPGGIRSGFTARRLSGRDKHWADIVSFASGLASSHSTTLSPQAGAPEVRFEGGDSGGGGATSDF
jgi:hypothetical protein